MMISQIETPRFVSSKPNPAAKVRLFCFPYAGAGPQVYRNWPQKLSRFIEFFAVQLAGRGTRLNERPYTSVVNAAEDLIGSFERYLDKPIVLFGHSLGALMCFELAHRLRDKYGIEPSLLIVSGRGAPQVPNDDPPTYDLPDPEFINELRRLNGTPSEVLEHTALMELMLPIIKADFKMSETYTFIERPPLNCPLVAMGGINDPGLDRNSLEAWGELTKGSFSMHMVPGDHFMIHSAESAVVGWVNHDLNAVINNPDSGQTRKWQ